MKKLLFTAVLAFPVFVFAQHHGPSEPSEKLAETHLLNVRQLTRGGDNAEAYWSPDGKKLSFQSNRGLRADQIFWMDAEKAAADTAYKKPLVSTGTGRTTCAFYMPNNKDVLYASTHGAGPQIPDAGDLRSGGKYLWPIFDSYDIYVASKKGKIKKQLTDAPGYDAEATVSPDGKKIVFTSTRGGDLDLWIMDIDGKNPRQITRELGYDGGAFFSPDGKKLVFRASRFASEAEREEYRENLKKGLVAPTNMEIFTINVDGTGLRQVTKLGKANWAPFFHPDGKRIIFSSNHKSARGYDFQLYMIAEDGTGLEQITSESIFNAFAMFSPDGKKLVFCSNRNNGGGRDTNVFVADWKD